MRHEYGWFAEMSYSIPMYAVVNCTKHIYPCAEVKIFIHWSISWLTHKRFHAFLFPIDLCKYGNLMQFRLDDLLLSLFNLWTTSRNGNRRCIRTDLPKGLNSRTMTHNIVSMQIECFKDSQQKCCLVIVNRRCCFHIAGRRCVSGHECSHFYSIFIFLFSSHPQSVKDNWYQTTATHRTCVCDCVSSKFFWNE